MNLHESNKNVNILLRYTFQMFIELFTIIVSCEKAYFFLHNLSVAL